MPTTTPTITRTSTAGNDAVEPCSTPLPTEDTYGVEEIVDAEEIVDGAGHEDENVTEISIQQASRIEPRIIVEQSDWLGSKRRLENRVKTLRSHLHKRRMECKKLKKMLQRKRLTKCKSKKTQTVYTQSPDDNEEVLEGMSSDSEGEITEEEPDDDDDIFQTETEEESEDSGDETSQLPNRISMQNTNLRTEPKHIVFLSQLLLLFKFCHSCKDDSPLVDVTQVGTEVIVSTSCKNPKCEKKETVWHSQPTIPGFGIPAGNFLLCMAILLAGGSITKVSQIFMHMGLSCVSLNTFFKHQRTKLFPTIYIYWQKYQKKLLEKVKSMSSGIVLAGDGRHDSMGHSAKYGVYTMFCCSVSMIIHFALVQVCLNSQLSNEK